MASTGTSLAPLAALVRDGENVIAPHVVDSDEEPALGALAAAGPRAAEAPEEYLLLVEAIREGYLLHYESPRVIQGADSDLRLLAGDYLYALGLERLAARGDLEAVGELADLISLAAKIHAVRYRSRKPAPLGKCALRMFMWGSEGDCIVDEPTFVKYLPKGKRLGDYRF